MSLWFGFHFPAATFSLILEQDVKNIADSITLIKSILTCLIPYLIYHPFTRKVENEYSEAQKIGEITLQLLNTTIDEIDKSLKCFNDSKQLALDANRLANHAYRQIINASQVRKLRQTYYIKSIALNPGTNARNIPNCSNVNLSFARFTMKVLRHSVTLKRG